MFGISEPGRDSSPLTGLTTIPAPTLLTQLNSNITNLKFRFIRVGKFIEMKSIMLITIVRDSMESPYPAINADENSLAQ